MIVQGSIYVADSYMAHVRKTTRLLDEGHILWRARLLGREAYNAGDPEEGEWRWAVMHGGTTATPSPSAWTETALLASSPAGTVIVWRGLTTAKREMRETQLVDTVAGVGGISFAALFDRRVLSTNRSFQRARDRLIDVHATTYRTLVQARTVDPRFTRTDYDIATPITVDVGSELHCALDCAFGVLARMRR